jgi:endonuclease/exonuclease/phosphatase family metal-dependent hydrolase
MPPTFSGTPETFVLAVASGCGPKVALEPTLVAPPIVSDPSLALDLPEVRWIREESFAENAPWRAAVGPAVIVSGERPAASVLDSLVVVSWNTHVGGGDVDRLIHDLRAGELTEGRPPGDFVLVLQEVFRSGEAVPGTVPEGWKCADAICAVTPGGERLSVEQLAGRHGLDLFYVPSMRNGHFAETSEDRGNAILSTIPLSDWTAVELPVAVQRRVAVGATVRGTTRTGSPWELDLISLHLDGRTPWRHVFGSFGRGRTRQLEFLTRAVAGGGPAVLAGDLNTWFRGSGESAVVLARRHFPEPVEHPTDVTFELGPWGRQLDWVFFRVPEGWAADYRRLPEKYGSDHYPLLARVRFDVSSRSADAPIPRTTRRLG